MELEWQHVHRGGNVSYEQVSVWRPSSKPMTDNEVNEMVQGLITLVNFPYFLIKKVVRFCC